MGVAWMAIAWMLFGGGGGVNRSLVSSNEEERLGPRDRSSGC